jgi:hypothetical protein
MSSFIADSSWATFCFFIKSRIASRMSSDLFAYHPCWIICSISSTMRFVSFAGTVSISRGFIKYYNGDTI